VGVFLSGETIASSIFVTVNCPLNDETEISIDANLFSLMKPTAYLINTARGSIVDQDDLVNALKSRQIAGAGLDVFAPEPLPPEHALTALDNVILAPHALAWTDDLYLGNSTAACGNVLTILQGQVPKHTVNREVLAQPGFKAKLAALGRRWVALASGTREEGQDETQPS
jgi:phosphoglycerate dehydrogenase-like enzyme